MSTTVAERSLSHLLRRRLEREELFAKTGRKFRNKPWILKHDRQWLHPLMTAALRAAGLYERGFRNATTPLLRKLPLFFDNLPAGLEGFQILHLSDLHIDGVPGFSEALRDVLSELHPDVCVLTGDYRFEDDGPCEAIYPCMRTVISGISARHGIFGILGNHDAAEIAFELEDMGVRMLINEAIEIGDHRDSFWLAGVDDPFDYQCDDLPAALSSVPGSAFKVLLAHTPELYQQASGHGVDLYLCGHTHAGQIRFPLIGSIRHNAACPRAYSYGYWTYGGMQAYTSAGTGSSGIPVRFNCPAEMILVELRRGDSSVEPKQSVR